MALSFVIRKYQPSDREACRGLWRELTEWHREIYNDPNIDSAHARMHLKTFPIARKVSPLAKALGCFACMQKSNF